MFVALLFLLVLISAPVTAQTVTRTPATALVLGNVAEGTATTTFTVASDGTVTRSPNNSTGAVRVLATAAPTPTITVTCTTGQCNNRPVQVRIALVSASSRLTLLQWLPGSFTYSSGAAQTVPPSGTTTVTFSVLFNSISGSMTFKLGHSMTMAATGTTGAADLTYQVTAGFNTAPTSGGVTGTLSSTIFRALTIARDRHLVFGKIVRPSSGSGTVTIDAVSGARSFSGNVILVNDATTGRAQFTTTGELGKAITVSVPTTVTMTRETGPETISFNTVTDGTGSTTLDASAGAPSGAGVRVSGIGGTISVDSATPGGVYSATINVTSSYN